MFEIKKSERLDDILGDTFPVNKILSDATS